MTIWSSTDFPYQCLLDFKRTTNLKAAIHATVRKGDIVLDAGAGSGVLSFFAAQAGARKVYAVEVDRTLAACLTRSIVANNLSHVVEVVHDDIHSANVPDTVDVFICEMMETGLMDEMQVTAINSLRERSIIAPRTRMIPFQYETFIEFGYSDFTFYGFKLLVPQHNWTHYSDGSNGWLSTVFHPHTDPHRIGLVDFQQPIETEVSTTFPLSATSDGLINAVRLSANAHLVKGLVLGATNAMNGDKVIPIDETRVEQGGAYRAEVSYRMGGGLESLQVRLVRE
jgi:protein arginine N-methyltransferase 1